MSVRDEYVYIETIVFRLLLVLSDRNIDDKTDFWKKLHSNMKFNYGNQPYF